MTTANIGIFAYGATVGWLGILFVRPSQWRNWRSLAFAGALYSACIVLCWWYGGIESARFVTLGLATGALGAVCIRFNRVVDNR